MELRALIMVILFILFQYPILAQPVDPVVDSLKTALQQAKADSNQVKLLMDLGNNVSYYDPQTALSYAEKGLTLSKKINYQTGEGRTHYLLGNTYLDLGNYPLAREHLDAAWQVFRKLKRRDMLGKIHNARGNMYYLQGQLWFATDEYGKAITTFHQLKDTLLEVIPYQNLIAALGETKNHAQAIKRSKTLLNIVQKRRDSLQMAYCWYYLCNNYITLNQLAKAEPYLHQLTAYIQQTKDLGLAADAHNIIGLYHFKKKAYPQALNEYQLALAKALRGDYQKAEYHRAIGRAYLEMNDLKQARASLLIAEKEAQAAQSKDLYYLVCRDLSDYYAKSGQPEQAFSYLQIYNRLNDSILLATTRQYTSYLEALFTHQKQESEILQLKSVQLEKDLTLKQRNNYLLMALGSLGLLGLFFAFKARNDHSRRLLLEQGQKLQAERIQTLEKTQQVISLQSMISGEESERNRIARDLHDGLGGLFSTVKMYFSSLQYEQAATGNHPLFQKCLELTNTASEELRRIAHNLMPEVLLKLGLINAIQDLCAQLNSGQLLSIRLQAYGMEERLQAQTEVMLYRIVQELLHNILKHAQATEVIIQFNRHQQHLNITIEDNGRGFNTTKMEKSGAGLSSIQSRVDYLNGALNIDSTQGLGTTVMMDFILKT